MNREYFPYNLYILYIIIYSFFIKDKCINIIPKYGAKQNILLDLFGILLETFGILLETFGILLETYNY